MAKQVKKPLDNSVDFDTLRKRRRRATTFKRILVLAGVMVLILTALFLNNLLIEENISTHISDLVQGFGGSGYPVALPGGVIRDVKHVGNHLAVLGDSNLYIYSSKGKQVGNFQRMSENTVLLSSENRMLTYDAGAKQYAIHSKSKTLHEQPTEYGIITADLSDRGDYAIVSSAKQFICEINVYNKQNDLVYTHQIPENLVTSVSISPKGSMMVAGWINGRDGALYSGINMYRLSKEGILAETEFVDEMILDVQFLDENRIAVLTDRQYRILDADGGVKASYNFGGRQIRAIERSGKLALLQLKDGETRTEDIVLLDEGLEEKAAYSPVGKLLDIALDSRHIYILENDSITTYDLAFQTSSEPVMLQRASRIHVVGSKLYYLTQDSIELLGSERAKAEASEEQSPDDDASAAADSSAVSEDIAQSSASTPKEAENLAADTEDTGEDGTLDEEAG